MQIVIVILSIVCVVAIYCCIIMQKKRKLFLQKIDSHEKEIYLRQATEQQLKKELDVLQNKLQLAIEDPVTHLLGWQLFEDRLNHSIKESERYQFTMGVLYIDIDNFKVITEAVSREVGNELLCHIAERLQTCIRQVDTLTRFSKDTFVVLLMQLAKPETAAVVAQRMLQTFHEPFRIKEHELFTTASIGISIFPTDGKESTVLLRSAEQALQIAKEKGGRAYHFYHDTTQINSQRELALYNSLRRDSMYQEMAVCYQPIFNTNDHSIFAMEAKLHWQHPELGLILQDEFFNYAAKQGKTNNITEWLLQHICQQFLHWQSLGFHPACIGIPISIKQLENSHFIYRISQILQESQFKPEWLLLEIRDSATPMSFDILEKAFNMLNYLGVKIAIEHFGLEAFSFCHLKNFTVNYLKLHPTLINDIHTNPQTANIVKALIPLGKPLSIEFIASSVEIEQQVDILKNSGCYLMEGKFFTQPISEEDVIDKVLSLQSI